MANQGMEFESRVYAQVGRPENGTLSQQNSDLARVERLSPVALTAEPVVTDV
ncbi:hypothetical protein M413DRAFT_447335, partial [Hebeloma cylindrosporum]